VITVAFDWVGALGAPAATAAAGLAAVATAAPAAVTDLTIDPTHNCDPDLDPTPDQDLVTVGLCAGAAMGAGAALDVGVV
jgi:hypothetical protein